MSDKIKAGEAEYIENGHMTGSRQASESHIYDVEYKGQLIRCVWDVDREKLLTVLPR
jgi:hypothetical protein